MQKDILRIRNYIKGDSTDPLFSVNKSRVRLSNSYLLSTSQREFFLVSQKWSLFYDAGIIITDYSYTANRMGAAPLQASLMFPICLDDAWDGTQYVQFRGENYFIRQTPSSSKDNDDVRYKHDIVFVSERDSLNEIFFYDVVSGGHGGTGYVSNSTKVIFMGNITEFVSRLNSALIYNRSQYSVVIDYGVSDDDIKLISLEDQYIYDVLQYGFNTFNVPFYFEGRVIHFGYSNNQITQPLRYGADEQLLSISKINANYKIVNRCTGVGSSDNIPFYYPNSSNNREEIEAGGGVWIPPTGTLMPPIYRDSNGSNRFYPAVNRTYVIPNTSPTQYYHFENEYKLVNPKEHKVSFPEIKPTIVGTLNASGQRIDAIIDIAFDLNDSDSIDESTGEYKHPYFYVKLNKFNGEYGFNLFDHAIVGNDMMLSLTTGNCAACSFMIGVDDDTQKNPVQVDEAGNLIRDKEGNVVRSGVPQDAQNNTVTNEVWIALKKDKDTFGVIMPNRESRYEPSRLDKFVLLNIDLPFSYVRNAEDKLKESIVKYMAENNREKFNFSINFSRVYLAENPHIESNLNENATVNIEYNGKFYSLYVSSFTYRKESGIILPEISVQLSDTITVSKGTLQESIDEVKNDILNSLSGADTLKQGLRYFLRKDIRDVAREPIKFEKGTEFGRRFIEGLTGSGGKIDGKGNAWLRSLTLYDFLEVPELIYNRIQIQDGEEWNASGGGIIDRIEVIQPEDPDPEPTKSEEPESYLAYLKLESGAKSSIAVGDICKGIKHYAAGFSTSYFKITEIGTTETETFFKYELKPGTSIHPEPLMNFVCYGSFTDKKRQKSSYQTRSYSRYLSNVNNWDITPANIMMQLGDLTGLNISGEDMSGYSAYLNNVYFSGFIKSLKPAIDEALDAAKKYADSITGGLQDQIDGVVDSWFYSYSPTIYNYPANQWTTPQLKKSHIGDTFTNTQSYISDKETPDAGKSWRFVEVSGSYLWTPIADSDAVKALLEASKAQATADGKMRVFTSTPYPPYDVGDLWTQGYQGEIMICKNQRTSGLFNAADWERASKYTDDTTANEAKDLANQAKKDLGNLNEYVDGSFKDGVISEAEAVGIEKYINTVNETIAKLDPVYNQLKKSPYLDNNSKQNLTTRYNSLVSAKENLIKAINDAIADRKTNAEEKKAVDDNFDSFNKAIGLFQIAVEEANKAIQDRLNDIQIGCRNYLLNSQSVKIVASSNPYNYYRLPVSKDIKTEKMQFSADVVQSSGITKFQIIFFNESVTSAGSTAIVEIAGGKALGYIDCVDLSKSKYLLIYAGEIGATQGKSLELKNVMLSNGNRPTDWVPAPEDDAERINSLEYIKDIFSDVPLTEIGTGYVFTSIFGAVDSANKLRSFMNGDPSKMGGAAFAAGIQNDGRRLFSVAHDGSMKAVAGQIGNFTMEYDKLRAKNIQLIDGNMPALNDLAGDAEIVTTTVRNTDSSAYKTILSTQRTFTIDKPMTLIMGGSDRCSANVNCSASVKEFEGGYEQLGDVAVYLKALNMKVYKVTPARGSEEVFSYYDSTQLGDSGSSYASYSLPILTTTLSEGTYKIEATISVEAFPKQPIMLPYKPWIYVDMNLYGYELRPLASMTYIADNGITSFFGYSDYMRHEAKGAFTIRKGNYMLRVSESGLQKSANGGSSWVNI